MGTYNLPPKSDIERALGQEGMTMRVYHDYTSLIRVINDYDEPIAFEYALYRAYHDYDYSINPSADNAYKQHKTRLNKLAQWRPTIVHDVVGRIPKDEIWVDAVLADLNESKLTSENMNDVQRRCSELSDERDQQYRDATGRELKERVIGNKDLSTSTDSLEDVVDEIVSEVVDLAIGELPQRQKSRSQGTKSSGGYANEEIGYRILRAEGLVDKAADSDNYDFDTATDDEDILICSSNAENLSIEVKSEATKERVGRSLGDENDEHWVLFGFFTSGQEVRSDIIDGNSQGKPLTKQAKAIYTPPSLIEDIVDIDTNSSETVHTLTNNDGKLYLRSNTEFASDMDEYASTGVLPKLSAGHHTQYL